MASKVLVLYMAAPDVNRVILFFFFFIPFAATSVHVCPTSSCTISSGPIVRFPFRLINNQSYRCGYPGFDLFCNEREQIVVNLPSSGDFIVKSIDYITHSISLNDPENCLPKRLLQNFSASGSSFSPSYITKSYSFFNCSPATIVPPILQIPCLGGKNYSVAAIGSDIAGNFRFLFSSCIQFPEVVVPMRLLYTSFNLPQDIQLSWREPYCGNCEQQGGVCGFKNKDHGLDIGCSNPHSDPEGISKSSKYGLIIGIGVPGFLCIIGLIIRANGNTTSSDQGTSHNIEISATRQAAITLTGLDGTTIESYPKTVLDESRRQLTPNDSNCAICLSDYMPKQTIRTIPKCNHYFHAQCIDEWLRRSATCPICRNFPNGPSLINPCPSQSTTAV